MSRFLHKTVQHINRLFKFDRVDRSICVAVEVVDQFEHARAPVMRPHFGCRRRAALLNQPKVVAHKVFDFGGKFAQILLTAFDPDERLPQA